MPASPTSAPTSPRILGRRVATTPAAAGRYGAKADTAADTPGDTGAGTPPADGQPAVAALVEKALADQGIVVTSPPSSSSNGAAPA